MFVCVCECVCVLVVADRSLSLPFALWIRRGSDRRTEGKKARELERERVAESKRAGEGVKE